MDARIIITNDGSHTIYLPMLDETYHSKFGAVNESKHVFIDNGLAKIEKKQINIFELGFGTGLNVLLAALYADNNGLIINYTTIEKFPLLSDVISKLNYSKQLINSVNIFQKIHQAEWGTWQRITDHFLLRKIEDDILSNEFLIPENIDVIYFDAFAPSKQAELWDAKLFQKLFITLLPGGCLVTYSAAGVVKQSLRKAGFIVKRLPGPAGKHHMLIATKSE